MTKAILHIIVSLAFSITGCATALHTASRNGDTKTVAELLDKGEYDINIRAYGCTPLHYSAMYGQINTTRLLLDRGADKNAQCKDWDALTYAAFRGYTDVAELLIARGLDAEQAKGNLQRYGGSDSLAGIRLLDRLAKKPDPGLQSISAKTETGVAGRTTPAVPSAKSPFIEGAGKDGIKIAVWDLMARETKAGYAQELTSILVSELTRLGISEVYSQDNVRTLAGWTEERMKLGCTNTQCLTALGQMDVAKLISGSVGKIGRRYTVSLNLFNTQKARAENAISKTCESEDELIELIQASVRELLGESPADHRKGDVRSE